MVKLLKNIFGKPAIGALCAGVGVHILFAMNDYAVGGRNYFVSLFDNFLRMPLYSSIKLSVPFFIPMAVLLINKRAVEQKISRTLMEFPESNPDIVMKLGFSGDIRYINSSARSYLEHFGLPEQSAEQLLPDQYRLMLKDLNGPAKPLILEKEMQGSVFEFIFHNSESDEVFVSGRNITDRKRIEKALITSHQHISTMTEFLDGTLKSYDPLSFEINKHYLHIVETLLRDERDGFDIKKPTHIFLTSKNPDGSLSGHVYSSRGGAVVQDPERITVDPLKSRFAITRGSRDVIFSNWEDETKNISEYQAQFHEAVRSKIGSIERYAAYTSGNVAIIAFYRGERLDALDASVLKSLAVYAGSLNRISEENRETENAFIYAIGALARAAEVNDEDTGDHIVRVNGYSRIIAEQLGLDADFIKKIGYSAQMHDVGKIHIHPDILKKAGKLTDEEFRQIKLHPEYGARIIGDSPRLAMAREIALTHHEKFNGRGYPKGMRGEEIPVSGRIVMLADVYDALRQERAYKPAFAHENALRIISQGDGRTDPTDFDPEILKAFIKREDAIKEIFNSGTPE